MIFPALNPDDDKLFCVLRFELPQLREYVDAVNSTVRPEIQKDDLSSQIRELEIVPACMNPVEIVGKFRGPHRGSGSEFACHLRLMKRFPACQDLHEPR